MKDGIPSSSSTSYSYRPFIKNISIEQGPSDRRKSGDASNKTFFSNIKAQLNNIRTDVNKLVSKDINKTSNNKSYTMGSSAQRGQPAINDSSYERFNERVNERINERKEKQIQSHQKIASSNSYMYESKINELQSRLNFQTNKNQELINQIEDEKRLISNLREQVSNFKQKEMRFEFQNSQKNKQIENQKFLYQRLLREKQESSKIIERLQSDARKNSFKTVTKIEPDIQLLEKIKNYEAIMQNLEKQLHNQRQENYRFKCQNENFKKKREEESRKSENDFDRNKNLIEENQKLKFQLSNFQILIQENTKLRQQLQNFEKNKQIEIVALSKNYEQKMSRAEAKSYKQLGTGFEVKINQLLDENYGLKNKIIVLESQIEQDKVQIESLRSTVQAYEARDQQVGKGAVEQQLQNLQQKVMQLQEQKDKMQSEHEYEIMKLENTIDELKSSKNKGSQNKNFNQILKDQINEIENLKERLREKNQVINKMKR